MSKTADEIYAANLELYKKLVATNPNVDRKGATMLYTSLNGHMFSLLTKEAILALRLPAGERERFLPAYLPNAKAAEATIMNMMMSSGHYLWTFHEFKSRQFSS